MAYFRICPTCGSHLDPGETCTDCRNKEDAAPVLQHRDGKAEKVLEGSDSASYDTEDWGGIQDGKI